MLAGLLALYVIMRAFWKLFGAVSLVLLLLHLLSFRVLLELSEESVESDFDGSSDLASLLLKDAALLLLLLLLLAASATFGVCSRKIKIGKRCLFFLLRRASALLSFLTIEHFLRIHLTLVT